jgi:hypothetical protein
MRRLPGSARCLSSGPDINARMCAVGRRSGPACGPAAASAPPPLGPTPLLLLDHPFADHLVHRRFHKRRRDRFAVAIPIPVVGDEGPVDLDAVMKFTHGLEQLLHPLRSIDARVEVTLQILSKLQGPVDVAVPEMPLQALELLLHRGRVQLAFLLVARSRGRAGAIISLPLTPSSDMADVSWVI